MTKRGRDDEGYEDEVKAGGADETTQERSTTPSTPGSWTRGLEVEQDDDNNITDNFVETRIVNNFGSDRRWCPHVDRIGTLALIHNVLVGIIMADDEYFYVSRQRNVEGRGFFELTHEHGLRNSRELARHLEELSNVLKGEGITSRPPFAFVAQEGQ